MKTVTIGPVDKPHGVLALGCWAFGGRHWGGADDDAAGEAMAAAVAAGMDHFDTAELYGKGHSEELVGRFLRNRRDEVFLATKAMVGGDDAEADVFARLDGSCRRLGADVIDLYYIHWPRKGRDMRPFMEAMEKARSQGKIRAIGVSNFSVEQMDQVSQVGTIDAHQLCYNLLWRFPEAEILPYCIEHDIAVVTYSSIAQGVLTGKFPREPRFRQDDHRANTVIFEPEVWPHVHAGVERLKELAERAARPLVHLAIRWVAAAAGVTSILLGARDAGQVAQNAAAMEGDLPEGTLARMTDISDEVIRHVPDAGNLFRYYP